MEILDYNYFKSRMPEMVITDIQAEVFDFRKNRVVPFAGKEHFVSPWHKGEK
mgnify:FL=1